MISLSHVNPQLNEGLLDKAHTALDMGLSDSRNLWIHTKLNFKEQQLCTGGEGNKKELVEKKETHFRGKQ